MPTEKCRTCGRKFEYENMLDHHWYPFCSERCRLTDLGYWFNEEYRLSEPVEPSREPDDGREENE